MKQRTQSEIKREEIIQYLNDFGEGNYIKHFCEIYGFDYQKLLSETLENSVAE